MRGLNKKLFSWKWLFSAVPIILYALSNRQSMPYFEQKHNVAANFWDYVLIPMNDAYLIVYYILPLITFVSTTYINRTFEYTKLIRLGSYRKWIFTKLKQLFVIDSYFMLIVLGAVLITSINTPFSMTWSDVGKINQQGNDILFYLQLYFPSPFIALVLQVALFILTFITIQLMLCILYAIYERQWLLHLMNALLFLMGTIGFKVFPASMKGLAVVNYLSLFHGTVAFDSALMPFGIMVITFATLVFIANNIDLNYSNIKLYVAKKIPMLLYISLCLMGILFTIDKYANENLSIWEIFIGTFLGTTNEMFDLLSFAYYVVVYLGAIYFVQLLLQRYLSEMNYYTMIRHRSMNKWFFSWFPRILKLTVVLLLSLFTGTISIAALQGYAVTVPENLFDILYQFMVNGFLQMLFYVLLVIIISLITRDVLKSFQSLLILTIFMFPVFRFNNLIPVGLNSMGYILENSSVLLTSAKLVGYIVVETMVVLYLLNKKDYTF